MLNTPDSRVYLQIMPAPYVPLAAVTRLTERLQAFSVMRDASHHLPNAPRTPNTDSFESGQPS